MRKFADVEARVAKVLADGAVVDSELAQAISTAAGVPDAVASGPTSLEDLLLPGFLQSPLKPGEVRNLGPVAGTGAYPGSRASRGLISAKSSRCPMARKWQFSVTPTPSFRSADLAIRITHQWRCR